MQTSRWALDSLLRDICTRAGVDFNRINAFSLFDRYCDGFSTGVDQSAFSAIDALASVFMFDAANHDGMLHFVPRGQAPVAHLTADDLIDDGKELRKLNRKDSISVPKVLHLEYYDLDGGLNADKQTSDRSLDSRSNAETKVQTKVTLSSEDAGRAAVIMHKVGIEEQRGGYEFALPDSYIWLTTGDIITLNNERLRITECEIDEGFQNYKTVFDRASAYSTTIKGVPVQKPIDPPSLIVGDTVLHFIDSPIIRDTDDRLGYYVALSRASDNWNGAIIELSLDGGETYIDSIEAEVEATVGQLEAPLATAHQAVPDEHNRTRVKLLLPDELESATLRDMLNRKNLALVGNELINFGEAEEVEPNLWELSHFLRGRKGTQPEQHAAGTRFILMERGYLWFIDAEVFELNRNITFRATSFGGTTSTTTTAQFTGASQRERIPAYVSAKREAGQLHINWQGVGRIGGGAQVRMGQYFGGYRVTVNGSEHITQQSTLSIAAPSGQATITVQQINTLTGAGPSVTVKA